MASAHQRGYKSDILESEGLVVDEGVLKGVALRPKTTASGNVGFSMLGKVLFKVNGRLYKFQVNGNCTAIHSSEWPDNRPGSEVSEEASA